MQKTIIIFVAGVLATGVLALYWFRYASKPTALQQVDSKQVTAVETKSKAGRILPDMTYDQHTSYERLLIDRYLAKYDNGYVSDYIENNPGTNAGDLVRLKYYDEETMLIGAIVCKMGCYYPLHIYDLNTDSILNTSTAGPDAGAVQNDTYIVWQSTDGTREFLYYYKSGARDFFKISGSNLESSTETYTALFGIGGIFAAIKFNGPSSVTADVFDPVLTSNGSSTKRLKTLYFNLP